MEKDKIKNLLRETFVNPLLEAEDEKDVKKRTKKTETEYAEVRRKLQNTMLKQNQVMQAAGLGDADSATDRSLFSKKVRKEKNEEGGVYQFNEKELASIIKVLNNPTSYLK